MVKWLLGEAGRARRSSSALRSSFSKLKFKSPPGGSGRPPMAAVLAVNSSPPPRVGVGQGCGSLVAGT